MTGKVRAKILTAKVAQLAARLESISELSKALTPENTPLFVQQTKDLDGIMTAFEESSYELEEVKLQLDENYSPSFDKINIASKLLCEIKVVLARVVPEPSSVAQRMSRGSLGPAICKVKLEPIKIMTFEGSPENWTPFYQQFLELIDQNEELTDLQKVSYLVSHLTGSAKSIVAGIPPTEANYGHLFQTLKNRFEDKRALGHYFLDKIMNFKPILQESEKGLNSFLEEFVGSTAAMKKLMQTSDLFDFCLVHIATKKLDPGTIRQFDMSFRSDDLPKFDDLVDFVRSQTKIIARSKKLVAPQKTSNSSQVFLAQESASNENDYGVQRKLTPSTNSDQQCPCCHSKHSHPLAKCSSFLKMEPRKRYDFVRRSRHCFRCLAKHFSNVCASNLNCSKCHRSHNSLLHFSDPPPSASPEAASTSCGMASTFHFPPVGDSPPSHAAAMNSSSHGSTVLLATAQVTVMDKFDHPVILRALLDNGSQSHFIRKDCCRKLGLTTQPVRTTVKCLGKSAASIQESTSFTFHSNVDAGVQFSIDALIMDDLTGRIPAVPVDLTAMKHLVGLDLADRAFSLPGPIDLLIGAQLWPLICGSRKIVGPPNTPVGLESSLGWLIMGSAGMVPPTSPNVYFASIEEPVEELLERFWLVEEVPTVPATSPNDAECEQLFVDNVHRNDDGRFVVALPFRLSPQALGDSFSMATRCFLALERRFSKSPEMHQQYGNIIRSYLDEGYLSLVSPEELNQGGVSYYIPHHGVAKADSSSTPLRIVLNASAKTSSGFSLNDILHVGPKLQNDLISVLLNFRLFQYAITTDVRQMYLRILMRPEDRRFQRIVWRFGPDEELQVYAMNTVVFGVAPSPFLALRVVHELIATEAHRLPLAAGSAKRDMYVDDYLSSVPSEEEACALLQQMNSMFSSGSFTLAKWASNSVRVFSLVPEDLRSTEYLSLDAAPSVKVLGLQWNPTQDVFSVKVNVPPVECSKRAMLSAIARIFDPLGFLAPLTILAKGLIKTLWALHLDWDETPSEAVCRQWRDFLNELPLLKDWCIPRHISILPGAYSALVGFSDASQTAYGAVLYVVTRSCDGETRVCLLLAKSKIAPMKTISIPRLELCAAVLLSSLIRLVLDRYLQRHTFDDVIALTDSTITLQWLSSSPSRWKVFVANRVSKIQQNTDPQWWFHVGGEENPADCLSRGLSARALLEHRMWFTGPSWLLQPFDVWPVTGVRDLGSPTRVMEEVVVSHAAVSAAPWVLHVLLDRVSTYQKLMHTTVYVLRALRLTQYRSGILHVAEIADAEKRWFRQIQLLHFPDIFLYLEASTKKTRNRLTRNPLIGRLDLFVADGIIRVGGRLQYSGLSYDRRHPVLLPKNDRFVELLIDQYHCDNLHTGPHLLQSLLSMRFWIVSARNLVRQRVHKCNICFKARPKPLEPKMAPLPSIRFQTYKAFLNSGVDYAGPFSISMSRQRGRPTLKAYVCLFICLSTKAVHLELASNLSTECFLAAYRRFLSRRGPCQVIISDQGTNFIGAKNKLEALYGTVASSKFNELIGRELSLRAVEWRLNPAASPHFGGIWERNIQTFKSYLYKCIGAQQLTYEEFNTVIIQIEALLNSRPLAVLSADPNGPTALTPSHFLTLGSPLDHLPDEDLSGVPSTRLDHYQLVTNIVQGFWKRWHQEYLHTLQARTKWTESAPSITEGTVVVIMKENSPPLHWPLAVVLELCPGPDGVVRVARLRTSNGETVRPLVRLCPLPTQ